MLIQPLEPANSNSLPLCLSPGNIPAHIAAQEGHLACFKFLLCNASDPDRVICARNDEGETPKDLANRFYKQNVVEFINNYEFEKDTLTEESIKLLGHTNNVLLYNH